MHVNDHKVQDMFTVTYFFFTVYDIFTKYTVYTHTICHSFINIIYYTCSIYSNV